MTVTAVDSFQNAITNYLGTVTFSSSDFLASFTPASYIAAMDLEGIMESLGHRVTGIARTETEALRLATAKRPSLVLADIQLADGSSGLDAVNEMLRSFEVPVIFITAYPERFLTGERPEPAFLIAKPFQPSTVSAVLSQALFFERNARRRERRAS